MAKGNGKALGIDDILNARDFEVEGVDCPEWGGVVYLRTMSGGERDAIDAKFQGGKDNPQKMMGVRAATVAACMCEADGTPLSITPEQMKRLSKKSAIPLDRCFDAAMRLSGITERDVEQLEKNSLPSGDSG